MKNQEKRLLKELQSIKQQLATALDNIEAIELDFIKNGIQYNAELLHALRSAANMSSQSSADIHQIVGIARAKSENH